MIMKRARQPVPGPWPRRKRENGKKVRKEMSEKDMAMLEKIKGLPAALQEKFVDRIDGAAMAVEALAASGNTAKGEDHGSNSTE